MSRKIAKNSTRFETSPIDDELVLIDVDTGKFFALKDVALRIWALMDEGHDLDRIADILCEEYEVEPDHARRSLASFADMLVDSGFARYE